MQCDERQNFSRKTVPAEVAVSASAGAYELTSPATPALDEVVFRMVAAALAVAIGLLFVLGVAFEKSGALVLEAFDLDGEWTSPAAFSTLLLVVAAVLALRLRTSLRPAGLAWSLAVILVFVAVDEGFQVHERIERSLSIDWQQLYLPAFAIALAVWCLLLVGIRRHTRPLGLVIASSCAWAASQFLEYAQWDIDRPVDNYTALMVLEEALEMTGTALLVVALLSLSSVIAPPAARVIVTMPVDS